MKTSLITAALALLALYFLTSCTLTVSPDGTRTWGVDGEQAARAIIIYAK